MSAVTKAWSGQDRRAHRRSRPEQPVAVLFGRSWEACDIIDVSQGGAAFRSQYQPEIDKEIIVRIDELGLFKCRVLRHWPDGFAARFEAADFGFEEPRAQGEPEPAAPRGPGAALPPAVTRSGR